MRAFKYILVFRAGSQSESNLYHVKKKNFFLEKSYIKEFGSYYRGSLNHVRIGSLNFGVCASVGGH